jgi:flagellar biosynthesis GTPase FlhF
MARTRQLARKRPIAVAVVVDTLRAADEESQPAHDNLNRLRKAVEDARAQRWVQQHRRDARSRRRLHRENLNRLRKAVEDARAQRCVQQHRRDARSRRRLHRETMNANLQTLLEYRLCTQPQWKHVHYHHQARHSRCIVNRTIARWTDLGLYDRPLDMRDLDLWLPDMRDWDL